MKLLDRLLVRSYLKAYVICLVSLLSLYIVMDLFMHIEEFMEKDRLVDVLKLIGTWYGFQVSQIFDRLCEAIVLMAAMFTVAWMQRNNEMMPLLSAGVSTRRVETPADSSGSSSLLRCIQATVNTAASSTMASPRLSKICERR